LRSANVFPVFLNRGQDEQNSDCQKHAADKLEPQLPQRSEEVAENDFELSTHSNFVWEMRRAEGQKRAQKQTLAYHLGAPTKAAKL
jgi:hypothetical protein